MLYSSSVVKLKRDAKVARFTFYACGWLSAKSPWLLVTYVDDENPTGALRSDLLIEPTALGTVLHGLDIRSAVLMRPQLVGAASGWTFDRIAEIWADNPEDSLNTLFVTDTGERWFASTRASIGTVELRRVYPHLAAWRRHSPAPSA